MKNFLTPLFQQTLLAVGVAFLLWFVMFSPWTAPLIPFWPTMACSASVLLLISFLGRHSQPDLQVIPLERESKQSVFWSMPLREVFFGFILGLCLAIFLWFVFWLGQIISSRLFSFAAHNIATVYTLKNETSPWIIGGLLLFLIGPAEEIFWRGYIQRNFSALINPNIGFAVTVLLYTFVHFFSFNVMLLLAAFVLGVIWGGIYWLNPRYLYLLIVSHALWDLFVFVLFPLN